MGEEKQINSNAQSTPKEKALKMRMRTGQLGSSIYGDGLPGNSKTENTQASSLKGGGIQKQQRKEMLEEGEGRNLELA